MNSNPHNESLMPLMTKDVYIKEVKGKALVDKNGLIQNIFGTGVFHGKEDKRCRTQFNF